METNTISTFLKKDNRLSQLVDEVSHLQKLDQLFHEILDMELIKYCQIATIDNKTLILIVENSSWATKLRYMIPEITKLLNIHPEFRNISKIKYRIKSTHDLPPRKPKPPKDPKDKARARKLMNFAKKKAKSSPILPFDKEEEQNVH